jgi:hypothetical protein
MFCKFFSVSNNIPTKDGRWTSQRRLKNLHKEGRWISEGILFKMFIKRAGPHCWPYHPSTMPK